MFYCFPRASGITFLIPNSHPKDNSRHLSRKITGTERCDFRHSRIQLVTLCLRALHCYNFCVFLVLARKLQTRFSRMKMRRKVRIYWRAKEKFSWLSHNMEVFESTYRQDGGLGMNNTIRVFTFNIRPKLPQN